MTTREDDYLIAQLRKAADIYERLCDRLEETEKIMWRKHREIERANLREFEIDVSLRKTGGA